MKLFAHKPRKNSGILLIECVTYIAVFAILTSVGFAAFYLCWNQSKAVVYATDDIAAALHAGERWRADIRSASGPILVEHGDSGESVEVPTHDKKIVYRFASGEVHREIPSARHDELLLPKVNSSQMQKEVREGITTWRWELNLAVRRPETQLPLLFTFEAVQSNQ